MQGLKMVRDGKHYLRVLEATSVGILVLYFIGPSFPLGFVHSSILSLAAVAVLCVVIFLPHYSLFLFVRKCLSQLDCTLSLHPIPFKSFSKFCANPFRHFIIH
ncbi:hypothetical protein AAZV13_20G048750 [Glycine max]